MLAEERVGQPFEPIPGAGGVRRAVPGSRSDAESLPEETVVKIEGADSDVPVGVQRHAQFVLQLKELL